MPPDDDNDLPDVDDDLKAEMSSLTPLIEHMAREDSVILETMEDKEDSNKRSSSNLQRIKLATRFFDEVLVPILAEKEIDDEGEVRGLIRSFSEQNPGPGSDFDIDHIWGVAFKRLVYLENILEEKGEDQLPENAEIVLRAYDLLTAIAVEK